MSAQGGLGWFGGGIVNEFISILQVMNQNFLRPAPSRVTSLIFEIAGPNKEHPILLSVLKFRVSEKFQFFISFLFVVRGVSYQL